MKKYAWAALAELELAQNQLLEKTLDALIEESGSRQGHVAEIKLAHRAVKDAQRKLLHALAGPKPGIPMIHSELIGEKSSCEFSRNDDGLYALKVRSPGRSFQSPSGYNSLDEMGEALHDDLPAGLDDLEDAIREQIRAAHFRVLELDSKPPTVRTTPLAQD
jgi:hypothetical protein